MATVYNRECLINETITDTDDPSLTMEFTKGQIYKATENIKGKCRIFSSYWVWMEAEKFGPPICWVGTNPKNGIQQCR